MTSKDDILRMAKEAGLRSAVLLHMWGKEEALCDSEIEELRQIERFAELVAAAKREQVAAWMMQRGYATGHGDTIEGLLKELEWQVRESEREACLVGIQAEIDHAHLNKLRLTPLFGQRQGEIAVRASSLDSALYAIRARGDK